MKLSDTALIVLNSAAGRDDRLVPRRSSVPTVADVNACRALVKQGLVEVVRAPLGAANIVTVREDDSPMAFLIADAGFRALNLDPRGRAETVATEAPMVPQGGPEGGDSQDAAVAPHAVTEAPMAAEGGEADTARVGATDGVQAVTDAAGAACGGYPSPTTAGAGGNPPFAATAGPTSLRQAAAALLVAWDDEANREGDVIASLEAPMTALRALVVGHTSRPANTGERRKPREGTKQQAVLTMLRREEGATVAQVMEATGWASHTVRGFFAGLKKKGNNVAVLERVRQVGPNKEGAKGSFTIYHVAPTA